MVACQKLYRDGGMMRSAIILEGQITTAHGVQATLEAHLRPVWTPHQTLTPVYRAHPDETPRGLLALTHVHHYVRARTYALGEVFLMKWFYNLRTGTKLIGGFLVVAVILAVVAVVGYVNMKAINDGLTSMYKDSTLPIEELGAADSAAYQLRGDVYKFLLLPVERTETEQSMASDSAEVNKELDLYRATDLGPEEKVGLRTFDIAWASYQKAVADIISEAKAGNERMAEQSLIDGAAHTSRQAVDDAATKLITINQSEADGLHNEGDVTFAVSTGAIFGAGVIGVLAAIGLGLLIARAITRPLAW